MLHHVRRLSDQVAFLLEGRKKDEKFREMWSWRRGYLCALLLCVLASLVRVGRSNLYPTPPLPLGPIPSASQLAFQEREMAMFFHFGMNTFTDSEWGSGADDPALFNPTQLDTDQWISVAQAAGFKLVILTVKHHDGFCLWQTKYTKYSVASSPWKGGSGDVLQDFVTSANKAGMKVGIYLSPWDRHDESYGDSLGYNEHYLAQIREILPKYVRFLPSSTLVISTSLFLLGRVCSSSIGTGQVLIPDGFHQLTLLL